MYVFYTLFDSDFCHAWAQRDVDLLCGRSNPRFMDWSQSSLTFWALAPLLGYIHKKELFTHHTTTIFWNIRFLRALEASFGAVQSLVTRIQYLPHALIPMLVCIWNPNLQEPVWCSEIDEYVAKMYIYIYIKNHTYIYIYVSIYIYTYIYILIYIYMYTYAIALLYT